MVFKFSSTYTSSKQQRSKLQCGTDLNDYLIRHDQYDEDGVDEDDDEDGGDDDGEEDGEDDDVVDNDDV